MARGTSGSSTRTTSRNIIVFKAAAVRMIISNNPQRGGEAEKRANACQQPPDHGDDHSDHDRLHHAGGVESQNQFRFGDGVTR